jgi:type II secretory pathway pseudopilin PulG
MPIKPGFSAVELLLVAGITSILVAIAVPGYLDAKLRAELVDVNNTLKEVRNSLIIYKIQYNQFPEKPQYNNTLNRLLNSQALPNPPFDRFKENVRSYGGFYSDSWIGYDFLDPQNKGHSQAYAKISSRLDIGPMNIYNDPLWYIKSIGPDQTDWRDEGEGRGSAHPNSYGMIEYQITNGLFSLGEIIKYRTDIGGND